MRFAGSAAAAAALLACACITPDVGSSSAALAPDWLLTIDGSGTWTDDADAERDRDVVYAWVDLRVANTRYHKRVLVEVAAPYEGGAVMRTLHPASYEGELGGGAEKWGCDSIELYPTGGPHGAHLGGPAMARARIQEDLDGDGVDEMSVTDWQPLYGDGEPIAMTDDPWVPGLDSPVSAADAGGEPIVLFAPFDDPGLTVLERIDAVIGRQLAAPDERHTLHAAVFNITDPEIVARLIDAHRIGVEVRLVVDGRKFRPWYAWHAGDDELMAAGVPVLGARRDASGAMHSKIAVFDGAEVATGSMNWEWGARHENHENMVLTDRADLVTAYARRFVALAGGPLRPRVVAGDAGAEVSVSFAPDERPHEIVGRLIDEATESVYVAMFTAKDVEYDEGGQPTSLLRKLVAANDRGVDVRVIVDHGIHEASEYHGIETPDDQTDEWLEAAGVHVVRADNTFGAYASMHHKFLTIDGRVAVTGAFNWYYDAAYRNDEDQLVWRDDAMARKFTGEMIDLLRRYDSDYDGDEWPTVRVDVAAHHDGTAWGEGVALVGDLGALGEWVVANGVQLDASGWPTWTASVELPMGTRFEYKLVTTGRDGAATWQAGANRTYTVPTDGGEAALEVGWW